MNMDKENQTPTQQLAEEITAALVDAGLIEAARKDNLIKEIAAGRITSDDWALLVDRAAEASGKGSTDGQ